MLTVEKTPHGWHEVEHSGTVAGMHQQISWHDLERALRAHGTFLNNEEATHFIVNEYGLKIVSKFTEPK